ncbi:nucleoside phosphatase GDA1/CD39 [Mycena amicta]|nr:nucleoside phosphatase GDA1/CD39 [Mycena amicta]
MSKRSKLAFVIGLLALPYTVAFTPENIQSPAAAEQDVLAAPQSPANFQYAVILDAGSTGTRLHIHNFTSSDSDSPAYLSTTFWQSPANFPLYHYGGRPLEAAESLKPFIEKAMAVVPAAQHSCTPIFLRASYTLRFHRSPKPENIMQAVEAWLRVEENSPFRLPDQAVDIMDPLDDTMYSWIAMNHLLGGGAEADVALLVLSRANSRIAFALPSESGYLGLALGSKAYELYLKAFHGTGTMLLDRVHESIVSSLSPEELQHGYRLAIGPGVVPRVNNPCIARGESEYIRLVRPASHKYVEEPFVMEGRDGGGFDACSVLVDEQLRLTETFRDMADMPPINASARVLLSGYFNDQLEPLLRPQENGSDDPIVTTVDQIAQLARVVCSGKEAWEDSWRTNPQVMPSWCLNLTLVHRLLMKGYRLDGPREVILGPKIRGVDTWDWTLGAAVKVVMDGAARCVT